MLGPVEGWLIKHRDTIGFIKGCFHPLPLLVYTPRLVGGAKTWATSGSVIIRCFDFPVNVVDPRRARLVSPLDAATLLKRRGCSARTCQAALDLLELFSATVGDYVGVTGGLAYRPETASDIDIVVYGWRQVREVYSLLRELREGNVTTPYTGVGHGWSLADKQLHAKLARTRLLFGLYKSVEYNVRLVACTSPMPCTRVRSIGRRRRLLRGTVCGGVTYTTPAYYQLCSDEGPRIVVTHRLRYTEIPLGALVEVNAVEQEICGQRILTPDHGGWVRVLALGREIDENNIRHGPGYGADG